MHYYDLYILEQSTTHKTVKPLSVGIERVFWASRRLAESRRSALELMLPEILPMLTEIDPTIKFISVYVGRRNVPGEKPGRLMPLTIVRKTGKIR